MAGKTTRVTSAGPVSKHVDKSASTNHTEKSSEASHILNTGVVGPIYRQVCGAFPAKPLKGMQIGLTRTQI